MAQAQRYALPATVMFKRNPRTKICRKDYYPEIFLANHSKKEEKPIQSYETDPGEQIA